MTDNMLTVSAPGRICLFGEHQDYLGLPVIAAAIDRRITISGTPRTDTVFRLDLPDIGGGYEIDYSKPVKYVLERDYFRSGINVLMRKGVRFPHGFDCVVRGNIPINSGTSSSSALSVAWIRFLLEAAEYAGRGDPLTTAVFAHEAEVLEFDEHGGKMDHLTSSFGNLVYLDFDDNTGIERLPGKTGEFVLGDSLEPKDTQNILRRIKTGVLDTLKLLKEKDTSLTMETITFEDLDQHRRLITPEQTGLLSANIVNRGLTQQARLLLRNAEIDDTKLGGLLNIHQDMLRDRLQISTPKIDQMIDASLENGALGAKINGSGGGGCMFAYAPDSFEEVCEAIKREGGQPYVIRTDRGVTVH